MNEDLKKLFGKAATHTYRSVTNRCRKCGVELPMLAKVTGTRLCGTCANPNGTAPQEQPSSAPNPFTGLANVAKRVQAALLTPISPGSVPSPPPPQVVSDGDPPLHTSPPPSAVAPAAPTGKCRTCGNTLPFAFRMTGRTDCDVCRATAMGLTREVAEAVIQMNRACSTPATYTSGPWGLRSGAGGKFTFDADHIIFTAGMFTKEAFRIPFVRVHEFAMDAKSSGLNISTTSTSNGAFSHSSSRVSQSVSAVLGIVFLDDLDKPEMVVFSGYGSSNVLTIQSKLKRAMHDYKLRNS